MDVAQGYGVNEICMAHCVLHYPTELDEANLRRIALITERFPDVVPGYSDHTVGAVCVEVAVAAVSIGARIIEKHFTLNIDWPGDDHYHSADPQLLARMVEKVRIAERALGVAYEGVLPSENNSRKYARRSILAARDIHKGEKITEDMLIMKRPGTGISPSQIAEVVGKKTNRNIAEDEAIAWDDLE
jgi:sialic acid synthase SpsE